MVSQSLTKTFMVETIDLQEGMKLDGAGFCVAPNYFITCAHVVKRYNKNEQKDLDLLENELVEKIEEIEKSDFKCSKSILCINCEYKMLCDS